MKKSILTLIILSLITTISAYGEGGTFIGGLYLDLNMIGAAFTFIIIFWAISFGTSKLHMFGSKSARILISMILALFSIYGLSKIGVSYDKLLINLGLDSILQIYFPHIIIAAIIICMLIFGLEVALMLFGSIFITLGIIASQTPDLIYNWGILLIIGGIILGIGLILKKKYPKKHIGRIRRNR